MSPVSDVASLFEVFRPLLTSGGDLENVPPEEIGQMVLAAESTESRVVLEMIPHAADYRFMSVVKPEFLQPGLTFEELEGDCTLFGTLDRVLSAGQELSLEQYALPRFNRAVRRAMGGEFADVVKSLGHALGREWDPEDLKFQGPGALIGTIALYP